jgi:hypothetical protein
MLGQACRVRVSPKRLAALILLVAPLMAGCGGPSAEDQLDAAFQNNPNAHRLQLAKFAGTVTIDNQPPGEQYNGVYVFLVDAEKYKDKDAPRWQTNVNKEGHFSFMTYLKDDGAPVGKYVVLFVAPESQKLGAREVTQNRLQSAGGKISGADALKNMYNDPEVNAKDPQFVLDLQQPGTTNRTFDLKVAGKDGPPAPGNYAVTSVRRPRMEFVQ